MISRYMHHGLTWVDLESPTREEILHLGEEFNLAKLTDEEMFSSTAESKLELYNNYIGLVLHFPQEINFIIGKNFLITVRHESIKAINEFVSFFEKGDLFEEHKKISTTNGIVMEMMKHLYKSSSKTLAGVDSTIDEIQHDLFKKKEKVLLKTISHTHQVVLGLKKIFSVHTDILYSYELLSRQLFGEGNDHIASLIVLECNKINTVLDSYNAILTALHKTNDSLLLAKSKWL